MSGSWERVRPAAVVLLTAGLCASTAAIAAAQAFEENPRTLASTVVPGATVWITDLGGAERRMRIVSVSDDMISASVGDEIRQLRAADIVRVRARQSDSVMNGALIGAGSAIAGGLLLCRLTETWENCRDDIGPISLMGAIGAGVGIGLDALIRRRQTIFDRSAGSSRLRAAPILAADAQGLQVSVRF